MLENIKNPCEGCHDEGACKLYMMSLAPEKCHRLTAYQAQCSILRDVVDWLRSTGDIYILQHEGWSEHTQESTHYYDIAKELEQLLKEKGIKEEG